MNMPTKESLSEKIKSIISNRGLAGFVSETLKYIKWKYLKLKENRFDNKYGLETGKSESNYLNKISSPNTEFAVAYEAIQADVFKKMMKNITSIIQNTNDFIFLDLGSGKGRALLYSAEYSFKKCIGVEFSQELHAIAVENIASYQNNTTGSNNFELLCMDVENYDLPEDNLVLFMYNPFTGKVMQSVLDKIKLFVENNQNDLVILYRNPTCADLFDTDFLTKVITADSYHIYQNSPVKTDTDRYS